MQRLGASILIAALVLSPLPAAALGSTDTGSTGTTPEAQVFSDAELDVRRLVINPTAAPDTSVAVNFSAPPAAGYDIELEHPDGTVDAIPTEQDGFYLIKHTWHAELTGLRPDTAYRYRVVRDDLDEESSAGPDSGAGDWHSFTTAAAGAADFDFLYFGDAQEGLRDAWPPVVDAGFEAVPEARLSIHAGDMVNWAPIQMEWDDWFAGLGENAADRLVMPVPGNHETYGDSRMRYFRMNFALPDNGATDETSYYYDYQGVRFVGLDGNRDLEAQAAWLDEVLTDNPHDWTVVTMHQPIFSSAVGRDEPEARAAIGPVLQEHDVDLVLQGHDHTYARGYVDEDATETPGVTSGPVYVISNAGPKHYQQQPIDDNTWTQNGATQVVRHGQVSTYQRIAIRGCELEYTSVIGAKGSNPTTDLGVGEVLDQFSIDRCGEDKLVTDGPIADDGRAPEDQNPDEDPRPGEEVPSEDPTPSDDDPTVAPTGDASPAPDDPETAAPTPDPTTDPTASPTTDPKASPTAGPSDAPDEEQPGREDDEDDEGTDPGQPGDDRSDGDRSDDPPRTEPRGGNGTEGGEDSGGDRGTLPRTGAEAGTALGVGAALIVLGATALILRRRLG